VAKKKSVEKKSLMIVLGVVIGVIIVFAVSNIFQNDSVEITGRQTDDESKLEVEKEPTCDEEEARNDPNLEWVRNTCKSWNALHLCYISPETGQNDPATRPCDQLCPEGSYGACLESIDGSQNDECRCYRNPPPLDEPKFA